MVKRRKRPARIWKRREFTGAALVSLVVVSVATGWLVVLHSLAAVQPIGPAGNWNLVFDDEFNGSSLDTTKWIPGWFGTGTTGPVNTSEDACYSSSNVSESGGVLNLNLVHQSSSCAGHNEPYTGSLVRSDGLFSFTYGFVEARMYLPGNGSVANWPAWWTDGQNWPTDGEMDVLEGLGGQACWHFHDPSGGPGGCASGNYSGWHTFGADWEPGIVTYYYDGVKVGTIASGITSAPMYLVLQNTTSSGSSTVAPANVQVDYVRAWSYAGANTPTPAPVHSGSASTSVPTIRSSSVGTSGSASGAGASATASSSTTSSAATPMPSASSAAGTGAGVGSDSTGGYGPAGSSSGNGQNGSGQPRTSRNSLTAAYSAHKGAVIAGSVVVIGIMLVLGSAVWRRSHRPSRPGERDSNNF